MLKRLEAAIILTVNVVRAGAGNASKSLSMVNALGAIWNMPR